MALSYKIRTFDTATGDILISVHNTAGTEVGAYNIDLPMDDDGLYLVGTALSDYITAFIPVDNFTRIEKVGAGVANASAITALLEPYPEQDNTDAPLDDEEAFQAAIDLRLKHHKLID